MSIASSRAFRATAILGFAGVALGAFGAHSLTELFARRPGAQTLWEKAVFYQLAHVAVMLLLACLEPFPFGPWACFGSGVILFSGSLYLLAWTGWRWFGILTPPFGGLLLLIGWLWLAIGRRGRLVSPFA